MRAHFADRHEVPLPPTHRFPISKYRRLRERLEAQADGLIRLVAAPMATREQLELAHDPGYVERMATGTISERELRPIGFPWSRELYQRSAHSVGGTIAACRAALDDGVAASLGGGTHHATRAAGAGYCVFNDTVIAARAMQRESGIAKVVVVDCDVHQGDGTADLTGDDPSIFTFSIHGADNFPYRKKTSDIDIALPSGTGDADYLQALDEGVDRALAGPKPDLVLFLAGADPFVDDRFGKLALSKAGLAKRDRRVLGACRDLGVPVAITMAGGYAPNVDDIVDINVRTLLIAAAGAKAAEPPGKAD
jgi:acetoin utilization deacetylase AcuC-like enzyme